jgi:hypothetical protein
MYAPCTLTCRVEKKHYSIIKFHGHYSLQLPWCTTTHDQGLRSDTKKAIQVLHFGDFNENKTNKPLSLKQGWCTTDDAPLSLQGMVLIIIFQYDLPRNLTTLMHVS